MPWYYIMHTYYSYIHSIRHLMIYDHRMWAVAVHPEPRTISSLHALSGDDPECNMIIDVNPSSKYLQ